jgi:ribosomal protein S18
MFNCHLIDLEALSHSNVIELRRFMTENSEIKPRAQTNLCAKCQRKVCKESHLIYRQMLTF